MDTQEMLREAMRLHRAGRLGEAGALYRGIVQQEPGNAEAVHLVGLALYQQGRLEEAAAWMERSIGIREEVEYLSNLGTVLDSLGRHDEAVAVHLRAIAKRPPRRGPSRLAGRRGIRRGDHPQPLVPSRRR